MKAVEGTRTLDLRITSAPLYQLSYNGNFDPEKYTGRVLIQQIQGPARGISYCLTRVTYAPSRVVSTRTTSPSWTNIGTCVRSPVSNSTVLVGALAVSP